MVKFTKIFFAVIISLLVCHCTRIDDGINICLNIAEQKNAVVYQLFYNTPGTEGFSEKRSIIVSKPAGFSGRIDFNCNVDYLKSLRFDFGSNPGNVLIESIQIDDNSGGTLLLSPQAILDNSSCVDIDNLSIFDRELSLLSYQPDPYIIIPEINFKNSSNNINFIDISIFSLIFYFLLTLLVRYGNQLLKDKLKVNLDIYSVLAFLSIFPIIDAIYQKENIFVYSAVILIILILLIRLVIKEKYKAETTFDKWLVAFSFLCALFTFFGKEASYYTEIFTRYNYFDLARVLLALTGWCIIYFYLVKQILNLICGNSCKIVVGNDFEGKAKTDRKFFLKMWSLLLLFYTPYFIAYYPGLLTYDSNIVLFTILGRIPMSDSHPILYVIFMKFIYDTGFFLFNDMTRSIAFCSFVQMFLVSGIYAYTIAFFKKLGLSNIVIFFAILFYGVFPLQSYYSITQLKDVLFSAFVLLSCVCLADIIIFKSRYTFNLNYYVPAFFALFGMLCFRHNGLYAMMFNIVILAVLLIFAKQKQINIFLLFVLTFTMFLVTKQVILNMYNLPILKATRAISIPVQQIGRTVYYDGNLSEDDLAYITSVTTIKDIKQSYNLVVADPGIGIWREANNENFNDFMNLWFSLLKKNPAIFVDAYIYQTYGFWYPLVLTRSPLILTYEGVEAERVHKINLDLRMHQTPEILRLIATKFYKLTSCPGLSVFWGIGLSIMINLFSCIVCCLKKGLRYLPIFVTTIVIWMTYLLTTPLFMEMRYMYFSMLTIPLSIGLILFVYKEPDLIYANKVKQLK